MNVDLISYMCLLRTAAIADQPSRATIFSVRTAFPHHDPMITSGFPRLGDYMLLGPAAIADGYSTTKLIDRVRRLPQ